MTGNVNERLRAGGVTRGGSRELGGAGAQAISIQEDKKTNSNLKMLAVDGGAARAVEKWPGRGEVPSRSPKRLRVGRSRDRECRSRLPWSDIQAKISK